jgi:hypothetical protein
MTTEEAFEQLLNPPPYVPNPIALEGGEAYKKRIPRKCCPYTDPKKKELWEFGWDVTDIGYMKSGEKYDDPKGWSHPDELGLLKRLYKKYSKI